MLMNERRTSVALLMVIAAALVLTMVVAGARRVEAQPTAGPAAAAPSATKLADEANAHGQIDTVGLSELSLQAYELGKAWQLRRESFWWTNLATLVLPALLTTLVAIMSALPAFSEKRIAGLPLTSVLAGTAAILVSVHMALKCEEYQAECLRLTGAYRGIAIDAEFALRSSRDHKEELTRLSEKLASVTETASATIPDRYKKQAKRDAKEEGYAKALAAKRLGTFLLRPVDPHLPLSGRPRG
jgi:hypothetical protein